MKKIRSIEFAVVPLLLILSSINLSFADEGYGDPFPGVPSMGEISGTRVVGDQNIACPWGSEKVIEARWIDVNDHSKGSVAEYTLCVKNYPSGLFPLRPEKPAVTPSPTPSPVATAAYVHLDSSGNVKNRIVCDAATCAMGSSFSNATLGPGERYLLESEYNPTPTPTPTPSPSPAPTPTQNSNSGSGSSSSSGTSSSSGSGSNTTTPVVPSTFSITYDANGGSSSPTNQIKSRGVEITLSNSIPVRSGHTFLGWNSRQDGKGVSFSAGSRFQEDGNLTLYAQWRTNANQITFDANGGTGGSTSQTSPRGQSYVIPSAIPVKPGYTFGSWNTQLNGGGKKYEAGSSFTDDTDLALFAQWIPNVLEVSFDYQNGQDLKKEQNLSDGILSAAPEVPSRIDHVFVGWGLLPITNDLISFPFNHKQIQDFKVYAQWKASPTYTVTFDANGGTGTPPSQTANRGRTLILTSGLPTRIGYKFSHWNTSTNGSGTSFESGRIYSGGSTTLYAQWNAEGGSSSSGSESANNRKPTKPTFSGVNFSGNKININVNLGSSASSRPDKVFLVAPDLGFTIANPLAGVISGSSATWTFEFDKLLSGKMIPLEIVGERNGVSSDPLQGSYRFPELVDPSKALTVPDAPTSFKSRIVGSSAVISAEASLKAGAIATEAILISNELGFRKSSPLKGDVLGKKVILEVPIKSSMAGKKFPVKIYLQNEKGESKPLEAILNIPSAPKIPNPSAVLPIPKAPKTVICARASQTRAFEGTSCPPGWVKR